MYVFFRIRPEFTIQTQFHIKEIQSQMNRFSNFNMLKKSFYKKVQCICEYTVSPEYNTVFTFFFIQYKLYRNCCVTLLDFNNTLLAIRGLSIFKKDTKKPDTHQGLGGLEEVMKAEQERRKKID